MSLRAPILTALCTLAACDGGRVVPPGMPGQAHPDASMAQAMDAGEATDAASTCPPGAVSTEADLVGFGYGSYDHDGASDPDVVCREGQTCLYTSLELEPGGQYLQEVVASTSWMTGAIGATQYFYEKGRWSVGNCGDVTFTPCTGTPRTESWRHDGEGFRGGRLWYRQRRASMLTHDRIEQSVQCP